MADANYANCTFFKILSIFVRYMVFRDFGIAYHESDAQFQNSKWPTQNGGCKQREIHIFSNFSAFLFDILHLGA